MMDIKGAKALKKRLGLNGADTAPPAAEPADIPADAPPVYHWTGKTPLMRPPRQTTTACLAALRSSVAWS